MDLLLVLIFFKFAHPCAVSLKFIPSSNFLSSLYFTQFGGSYLCLNLTNFLTSSLDKLIFYCLHCCGNYVLFYYVHHGDFGAYI